MGEAAREYAEARLGPDRAMACLDRMLADLLTRGTA
jgi:hypothetical protein